MPPKVHKELAVWDITFNFNDNKQSMSDHNLNAIHDFFTERTKKVVYQYERGHRTGRLHIQARVSLRTRLSEGACKSFFELKDAFIYISPTVGVNSKAFDYGVFDTALYQSKLDTRVEGPFSDKNPPPIITHDIKVMRAKGLHSWQQRIMEECIWFRDNDDRSGALGRVLNVLVDTQGNIGKGTLVSYLEFNKLAVSIPALPSWKDIMQIGMAKQSDAYLIDMPRAMNKTDRKALSELYTALESIKDGKFFDPRYSYKERRQERPLVRILCCFSLLNCCVGLDIHKHQAQV